jgi:hypothetical protein
MLKLNMDLSYDAKWYDFETGEEIEKSVAGRPSLKIKPDPLSRSNMIVRDGGVVLTGEEQCRMFKESLVDMNAVVGADDKPLPCTDEIKQKIYDFRMGGIADFVMEKLWAFRARKETDEKNLRR